MSRLEDHHWCRLVGLPVASRLVKLLWKAAHALFSQSRRKAEMYGNSYFIPCISVDRTLQGRWIHEIMIMREAILQGFASCPCGQTTVMHTKLDAW